MSMAQASRFYKAWDGMHILCSHEAIEVTSLTSAASCAQRMRIPSQAFWNRGSSSTVLRFWKSEGTSGSMELQWASKPGLSTFHRSTETKKTGRVLFLTRVSVSIWPCVTTWGKPPEPFWPRQSRPKLRKQRPKPRRNGLPTWCSDLLQYIDAKNKNVKYTALWMTFKVGNTWKKHCVPNSHLH